MSIEGPRSRGNGSESLFDKRFDAALEDGEMVISGQKIFADSVVYRLKLLESDASFANRPSEIQAAVKDLLIQLPQAELRNLLTKAAASDELGDNEAAQDWREEFERRVVDWQATGDVSAALVERLRSENETP